MTEEWLQLAVNCRRGIEHPYDIVEGPLADEQIWDYVEDFVDGAVSRAAFWELVKFKYPTHQIVFCTEPALQTLRFEGSIKLRKIGISPMRIFKVMTCFLSAI